MRKWYVLTGSAVLCLASVAAGDVLVEFSLYADTDFDEAGHVADVEMIIEGIDLMGLMPEGSGDYQASVSIETTWGIESSFIGAITGSLYEYEGEGWGGLGFSFPANAFPEFGGGGDSVSMEWSWAESDDGSPAFSYGLATWSGSLAESVGLEVLYLGWPISESTIPAPGALAILALAGLGRTRRRQS